MRLIDKEKQEVIDRLNLYALQYSDSLRVETSEEMSNSLSYDRDIMLKAIELLKQQPTVNQWISVEDELPKESGEYYCNYSEQGHYTMLNYDEKGFYFFDSDNDRFNIDCVNAWLKVEPYEPKGSE